MTYVIVRPGGLTDDPPTGHGLLTEDIKVCVCVCGVVWGVSWGQRTVCAKFNICVHF